MTSQIWQQVVAIYILLNISNSKDNQVTKFGHLTEYKMKNVFLEKLYTKCDGEVSPRLFYQKS